MKEKGNVGKREGERERMKLSMVELVSMLSINGKSSVPRDKIGRRMLLEVRENPTPNLMGKRKVNDQRFEERVGGAGE